MNFQAPNWVPGSTSGSRARNALSYFIFGLGIVLLTEVLFNWFEAVGLTALPIFTGVLALFGFVYFFTTTLGVIRLKSEQFFILPSRLFRDIVISIFYSIVAFAMHYQTTGIIPTFTTDLAISAREYIYFSIVTFSTLGYGDFRPSPDARLMAAAQALLGTIHIGMIVGAAFLTFSQQKTEKLDESHTHESKNSS